MDMISPEEIRDEVYRRLKTYEDLSLMEHFAMFMGKAQILEFGLKNLLVELYGYQWEKIKARTLGHTCRELKACGLRGDFIALLEAFVGYRNYIAHEFLLNSSLLRSILRDDIGRLEIKHLERGTILLEQLIFLYDRTSERDWWTEVA